MKKHGLVSRSAVEVDARRVDAMVSADGSASGLVRRTVATEATERIAITPAVAGVLCDYCVHEENRLLVCFNMNGLWTSR